MDIRPLLDAPLAVQIHVGCVAAAFLVGGWLLYLSSKGSPGHRMLGVGFLALMAAVALSSLFIHRSMPDSPVFGLSPTHLFVPFVLGMIWLAIDSVRRRDFKRHRFFAGGLFMGGLVVNGLINLILTHGVIHDVVFPAHPSLQARLDPPAIHGDFRP